MKTILRIFLLSALSIFFVAGTAMALPLGTNITIPDKVGTGSGWHGAQEDQEVEPGCIATQAWDLEGFFLNGTALTMVGGFNFKDGYGSYKSGDIFIDTTGDAKYGPDNTGTGSGLEVVNDSFGYEYALSLDFSSNLYTVHGLTGASTVTVFYGENEHANPWKWNHGGTMGTENDKYTFSFYQGLNDGDVGGLLGGTHYAVSLNLADFLAQDEIDNFIAHFTYQCGNDNLMGSNPVPEPATMLLLGVGLVGLAGVGRKKFFNK